MAKKKEEGPRSLATFLAQLADGRALPEMSEEFHALVKAGNAEALARDANVKGEFSLKLKLDFSPRGIVGIAYFPLSEEWQAWTKVSGEEVWLPQAAFAELLEARLLDVLDPASVPPGTRDVAEKLGLVLANAAALLTVAKGISVNATRTVTQAVNLSSGEVEVSFAEKHAGKGGDRVVVPQAFALRLPVFRGGAPYVVLARLRYRESEGVIRWGVRLHRADLCFRDAFTQACDRAQKETGLPLFYGTPE